MKLDSSSMLLHFVLYLLDDLVGKEDGRLDLSFSSAGRAHFFHLHFDGRSNALACDLHQAELTERQHIMFGAIAIHQLPHIVVQLLLMVFIIHIDEIDNDDSAYIAQTKLVHQLVGRQHIKLEGILLLVLE